MLTVPMVSERLKCSTQTVYTLIRTGRLPASRRLNNPHGAWQIEPEDVEAFLEAGRPARCDLNRVAVA